MEPHMTALHRLVDTIDQARPWPAPPVWIRICGPVAGPDCIEEDVGFDRLVGFVAPRRCSAVGVVAGGWATPLPGRTGTGRQGRQGREGRQRVRTTLLVDRDGMGAGRVRWASGRVVDEPPVSGRMLDCLRRALGLATDRPSVGTEALFASVWLAALATEPEESGGSAAPGARLTWRDAVALHPVREILGDEAPAGSGWLVEAARALAVACPWSEIRRLIAAGAWEESGIAPEAAAWMDDGMLCRWLLDGRVPLGQQLAAAVTRLSPQAARRVHGTLRELGLATGERQYL
jgi:hypothetical protein